MLARVNIEEGECGETGQEKTQDRSPKASKFCFWTSENLSLMVWWASEITLSSLVSDHFQSKTNSERLHDEQTHNPSILDLI